VERGEPPLGAVGLHLLDGEPRFSARIEVDLRSAVGELAFPDWQKEDRSRSGLGRGRNKGPKGRGGGRTVSGDVEGDEDGRSEEKLEEVTGFLSTVGGLREGKEVGKTSQRRRREERKKKRA
jgi:hypothetical protein